VRDSLLSWIPPWANSFLFFTTLSLVSRTIRVHSLVVHGVHGVRLVKVLTSFFAYGTLPYCSVYLCTMPYCDDDAHALYGSFHSFCTLCTVFAWSRSLHRFSPMGHSRTVPYTYIPYRTDVHCYTVPSCDDDAHALYGSFHSLCTVCTVCAWSWSSHRFSPMGHYSTIPFSYVPCRIVMTMHIIYTRNFTRCARCAHGHGHVIVFYLWEPSRTVTVPYCAVRHGRVRTLCHVFSTSSRCFYT
jgi:hypothetical protein